MRLCLKKILLTISGATVTFLLVAFVDQQRREEGGGQSGRAARFSVSPSGRGWTKGSLDGGGLAEPLRALYGYLAALVPFRRDAAARPRLPAPDLARKVELRDVFIAIKTTRKFHQSRLELLLSTWVSRAWEQTYIFTDDEDEELTIRTGHRVINTNCSSAHSRQALSCKMAAEYDVFIASRLKWFCHVDDDNYVNMRALLNLLSSFSPTQDIYIGKPSLDRPIEASEKLPNNKTRSVFFWFATGGAGFCINRGLALKMAPWASDGNFMNTAERIRLPDDCTIGYIIEAILGVNLIQSPLFHSHLENLQLVSKSQVQSQVTLSYGTFENKRNIIEMKGTFSDDQDPSSRTIDRPKPRERVAWETVSTVQTKDSRPFIVYFTQKHLGVLRRTPLTSVMVRVKGRRKVEVTCTGNFALSESTLGHSHFRKCCLNLKKGRRKTETHGLT